MTKREDYEKIIRETPLSERLDKCRKAIGDMCAEGRPPKMTIPAQWYDEDIYISTTLMDAKAELATVEDQWKTSLVANSKLLEQRDAWEAEAMAAREFIGVMAKRLSELAHDEELEDESEKVFRQYLAARVKDGE